MHRHTCTHAHVCTTNMHMRTHKKPPLRGHAPGPAAQAPVSVGPPIAMETGLHSSAADRLSPRWAGACQPARAPVRLK